MLIGELAKKSGLTRDTVRFYERIGLIHSEDKQAGSRVYNDFAPEMVERLAFIKQGQVAGFTLGEIKSLMDEWGTDINKVPKDEVVRRVEAKLEQTEEKIRHLEEVRSYLKAKLARYA